MAESPRGSRASKRKTPTIYDVAREARVSVFTVSAVINNKSHVGAPLKKRVDAAILKLNYRPNSLAQSLANERTKTLGVIVPDISNPFFPMLVRGAEDTAQKRGYSIVLCNSDGLLEKEERYIDLLVAKRVDGILLTKSPGELSPQTIGLLSSMKVPTVLMMRTYPSLTDDAVISDDLQGSFDAVSHLARIGHRSLAMVSGPLSVSDGRARLQGFKKALKAGKLKFNTKLVFEGDDRVDSGRRAGLSLLPHRPDAVFVTNFLMTVGFLQAAQEMGMRCPEDFGLITLDDFPWLRLFDPPLTAMELPKYEIGCMATELLLDRILGKVSPAVTHRIAQHLCVRESCGFGLRNGSSTMTAAPGLPALVARDALRGRRKAALSKN